MAMLNPGDEVIIPTPAFGLYESIVVANHAKAVFLDTEPAQFQIDEDALRAYVTPATKAIVICSPNNPTGCILNTESLDAVARVAEEAGIYVVCDDVYNRLVYVDGYERFAQRHPELREQTVVIESFSKPWAMTGWRLGWLAAATPVIAEIAKAHQYLVSSAVSFEMDAAARALTVDPTPMLEVYRARRERVLAALNAMGLDAVEPAGAFYTFPSIKKFGLTSEDFCPPSFRLCSPQGCNTSAHRPKHYEWGRQPTKTRAAQSQRRHAPPKARRKVFVDSARAEEHLMRSSCEPGLDRAKTLRLAFGGACRMVELCAARFSVDRRRGPRHNTFGSRTNPLPETAGANGSYPRA